MIRALFARFHTAVYRLLRGRIVGSWGKAPVLLLTTRGRRTGRSRTTPVLYLEDGDAYIVVATNDGADAQPAWYLNLVANPEAEIELGADRIAVTAETAAAHERARLWLALRDLYPNYARDQSRATRELPVVLLKPAVAAPLDP